MEVIAFPYQTKKVLGLLWYIVGYVILNVRDTIFTSPKKIVCKIYCIHPGDLVAKSIPGILITVLALFHISKHLIITPYILFLFSLLILFLFHVLKDPSQALQ